MKNPYDILGVPTNASEDEIKKAYRNLSRKYHPDANVNNPNKAQAEERFKEVQQAYQAIMDEKEGKRMGMQATHLVAFREMVVQGAQIIRKTKKILILGRL